VSCFIEQEARVLGRRPLGVVVPRTEPSPEQVEESVVDLLRTEEIAVLRAGRGHPAAPPADTRNHGWLKQVECFVNQPSFNMPNSASMPVSWSTGVSP
jgi:hypothetical protein